MALVLKIFYGDERCQNIYTTVSDMQDYQSLLSVCRQHIPYLNFIADNELRLNYEDDEGTFVNLVENDPESLQDALRCAKIVQGTEYRRLKIKITESTTPQSKKVRKSTSPASTVAVNRSEHFTSLPKPAKKSLSFQASSSTSESSNSKYKSPLERHIADIESKVEEQRKNVRTVEQKIELFTWKLPVVSKKSPACGNCHRREKHNRANCPYKPHKCESAFECGDIDKHRDEKDQLRELQSEYSAEKQKLKKLQLNLESKSIAAERTVNSFNAKMRNRLVESNKEKYLTRNGKENWRAINTDLSLLEQHFKGKVPSQDVDLYDVLQGILCRNNLVPKSKYSSTINEMWKSKGIVWPGSEECAGDQITPLFPTDAQDNKLPVSGFPTHFPSQLQSIAPTTESEEEDQISIAMRESIFLAKLQREGNSKKTSVGSSPTCTTTIVTSAEDEAANILLGLHRQK